MPRPQSHQAPPGGTLERVLELVAILGMMVCVGSLVATWNQLPPRVPVHFAWDGRPDAVGPRWVLLAVAGFCVFLYALLTVLTRLPWTFKYQGGIAAEKWYAAYAAVRTMVAACKAFTMVLFAWTEWRAIETSFGRASGLGSMFGPAIIVFTAGLVAAELRWLRRLRHPQPTRSGECLYGGTRTPSQVARQGDRRRLRRSRGMARMACKPHAPGLRRAVDIERGLPGHSRIRDSVDRHARPRGPITTTHDRHADCDPGRRP
jgi:hypothetical protein